MDIVQKPSLNIDELYGLKQKKDLNRMKIYNKLINKIHNKIKYTSKLLKNEEFCSFLMPEVLLGYPNYNFKECLYFVLDNLKEDGFNVRYVHPNLLLIYWGHWIPSYVREQIKEKINIEVNEYGEKENKTKSILKKSLTFK